jgi:hypothetical protein
MRESQGTSEEFKGPDSHVRIRVESGEESPEEALFDAVDRFTHPPDVMNDAILNTALVRNLRAASLKVSMGESQYGTPRPQVEVRFLRGTHYRKSSAALHALAAVIELATPTNEGWVVVVDPHADEVGTVYLELADGNQREATRGLELLKRALA